MTTYHSGAKPRYDDGGSEFGNMHRELPKNIGMFDVDRMQAKATVDLEITQQNVAFIEYRTVWHSDGNDIKWTALFEVKHHDGKAVQDALLMRKGTATWAQMKLAQALGARYFVVVATYGREPFTFYEVDSDGIALEAGVLDYGDNKEDAVRRFWKALELL